MKDEIYEINLKIKNLIEGTEKINSKLSSHKNYIQNLNL